MRKTLRAAARKAYGPSRSERTAFKLWNVPWHARGLNWGDVVRCERRDIEGGGEVMEVAGRCSAKRPRGFSLYFYAHTPDDQRDEALRDLEEMGAWFEWYEPGGEGGGRLYAVDVPPEADWRRVYDYLSEGEKKGAFGWQSSWTSERPDGAQ